MDDEYGVVDVRLMWTQSNDKIITVNESVINTPSEI